MYFYITKLTVYNIIIHAPIVCPLIHVFVHCLSIHPFIPPMAPHIILIPPFIHIVCPLIHVIIHCSSILSVCPFICTFIHLFNIPVTNSDIHDPVVTCGLGYKMQVTDIYHKLI